MSVVMDGITYQVRVRVDSLGRSFRIPDGENAGDLLSGRYSRDIIGTYYDYEMTVGSNALSETEYDALFEILTAPVESHEVVLPYGAGTLSFRAYIEDTSDSMTADNGKTRRWGNLSVQFYAQKPQRRPA